MEKAFLMQRALFRIFWNPALLFCLISIFACAQDFKVPDSWQKIAAAKDGEIVSVGIQDGWVVWMEKRLDSATAQHRAQSFFVGLYRMKLATGQVETLLEPSVSRVRGDQYILGYNGIVSSNYRGNSQQVFFSVNPTERMLLCPEEERSSEMPEMPGMMSEKSGQPKLIRVLGQGEYTPIRIYRDSLVCLGVYGQKVLVWVPFDGKKPDFERKQNIFGPTDAEIKDICVDKNMAVYSTDRSLTLYDIETQKIICTLESERMQFSHLYLHNNDIFFMMSSVKEIYRFSAKDKKLERMPLPVSFHTLLSFTDDVLYGVHYIPKKGFEVLGHDLVSGKLTKLNIPILKNTILNNRGPIENISYFGMVMPGGKGDKFNYFPRHLYLNIDAERGEVAVSFENTLYLVSQSKEPAGVWPSCGWTTAMPEEIKNALVIKDGKGEKISWSKPNTFIAAAVQAVSEMANPQENRRHLESLVREAAYHGAKVVVLPETAITGYMSYDLKTTWQIQGRRTTEGLSGRSPVGYAETVPGDSTKTFSQLASELGIYLTVPFLEIDPATECYYNSVVLMSPSGQCLKHYRKLNPWPYAERGWAAKGNFGNVYADTAYGRMGLLICYDINYEPPHLRSLGVDHLLYSIAWVDSRDSQWFSVSLPEIAKRNDINIIGANWTVPIGSIPDWYGYGKSLIIGRDGNVVAKTNQDIGEKIIYAELPIVKK